MPLLSGAGVGSGLIGLAAGVVSGLWTPGIEPSARLVIDPSDESKFVYGDFSRVASYASKSNNGIVLSQSDPNLRATHIPNNPYISFSSAAFLGINSRLGFPENPNLLAVGYIDIALAASNPTDARIFQLGEN